LLPPSLEDWVAAGHPVRFIREVVESLKLRELEFEEPNSEEGGECYAPQLLLSVWLYGYWRRIRSSRKLETACREEMAFIWLSGNTQPDHNTLWRFWAKNQAGIKNLFKRSVQMAMEMGEVDMALAAIDGTKIQALCSGSGLHSRQHNEKLFKKLESQIQELEQQIAQSADDQQQLERRPVLSEALRDKKRLAQRVREALRRSEQNGQGYVHPQEPDAQRMPMNSGLNRFGYNAQTAVDAKSQIIVASEVVNSPNDKHQLLPMLEAIKTTTGQAPAQTVADAGYSSAAQLQKAAQEGLEVYTQLITQSKAAVDAYHTRHFRYNRSTDCVECPQGQFLLDRPPSVSRNRADETVTINRDFPALREPHRKDRRNASLSLGSLNSPVSRSTDPGTKRIPLSVPQPSPHNFWQCTRGSLNPGPLGL
jgi:Transposase and inactivated derivatives